MTGFRDLIFDAALKDAMIERIPERGLPRPMFDGRPVPFAVRRDDDGNPMWAGIDSKLTMLCTLSNTCHMCGEYVADADAWAVYDLMGRAVDGWIMHQRCTKLSVSHCPFLSDVRNHDMYIATASDIAPKLRAADERKCAEGAT